MEEASTDKPSSPSPSSIVRGYIMMPLEYFQALKQSPTIPILKRVAPGSLTGICSPSNLPTGNFNQLNAFKVELYVGDLDMLDKECVPTVDPVPTDPTTAEPAPAQPLIGRSNANGGAPRILPVDVPEPQNDAHQHSHNFTGEAWNHDQHQQLAESTETTLTVAFPALSIWDDVDKYNEINGNPKCIIWNPARNMPAPAKPAVPHDTWQQFADQPIVNESCPKFVQQPIIREPRPQFLEDPYPQFVQQPVVQETFSQFFQQQIEMEPSSQFLPQQVQQFQNQPIFQEPCPQFLQQPIFWQPSPQCVEQSPIYQGPCPQFLPQPIIQESYPQFLHQQIVQEPYPQFTQLLAPVQMFTAQAQSPISPQRVEDGLAFWQEMQSCPTMMHRRCLSELQPNSLIETSLAAFLEEFPLACEEFDGNGGRGDAAARAVEQQPIATTQVPQFQVEDTPGKIIRNFNKKNLQQRNYGCHFCQSNGETAAYSNSHVLKSRKGRVICPILRKLVCPDCKATGDTAHTRRYCPTRAFDSEKNDPAAAAYGNIFKFCRNSSGSKQLVKF